jgi:hypothetical protein
MSEPLTAERIHAAYRGVAQIESDFGDLCCEIFGDDWPFEDFIFDDYDNSVEFLKASRPPTSVELTKVLALGFSRGWWCFPDHTEHTFWMDGDAARIGALKGSLR